MLVAFILWTAIALLFIIIGVFTRRSEKAAGFWANAKAPEVTDVKKYNKAASTIWFAFAVLFEAVGLPLLFCEQNSPLVFVTILGSVVLVIVLMIVVLRLENKYRRK